MTMRERMLAVIQGREHDRVPFVQYDNLVVPNEVLWSAIGRENMGILMPLAVHKIKQNICSIENKIIENDGNPGNRTIIHTPKGQLVQERFIVPDTKTKTRKVYHIQKYFIEEPEDYDIFLAYLRDIVVVEDFNSFYNAQKHLGEDGW